MNDNSHLKVAYFLPMIPGSPPPAPPPRAVRAALILPVLFLRALSCAALRISRPVEGWGGGSWLERGAAELSRAEQLETAATAAPAGVSLASFC